MREPPSDPADDPGAAAGWTTVVFHAGDVMRLELEGTVDAVVGRWVPQ